ncbi:hypothetical protein [Marinomonas primoryensis]|jgi:hypothetical protein|uniref:Uncharacterized protein n=1 Tax=Marinomonas primoryensis TaxID=178399 RepID=A0A859CZT1_9GAMM|nr:hypothetical protein [Marinomonas primoryensis]QKK82216.1 uncharacterized protein MP3633_3489 [Marinomonas primoryensis]
MFNFFKKHNHAENAHAKALDILSEIGVVEMIGSLHREALLGNLDSAEIRALMIGAYRTVGIGAGIGFCIMQEAHMPKEEISKMYWGFVNESSIRQIAVNIYASLNDVVNMPPLISIVERERELLTNVGFDIYHSYINNMLERAHEQWRVGVQGEVASPT